MDQRVNIIPLGVDDVSRARAFYERLSREVAYVKGLTLHEDGTVALGAAA